jgi:hypothetical protein
MVAEMKALGDFRPFNNEKCLSLVYLIVKYQLKAREIHKVQHQKDIDGYF